MDYHNPPYAYRVDSNFETKTVKSFFGVAKMMRQDGYDDDFIGMRRSYFCRETGTFYCEAWREISDQKMINNYIQACYREFVAVRNEANSAAQKKRNKRIKQGLSPEVRKHDHRARRADVFLKDGTKVAQNVILAQWAQENGVDERNLMATARLKRKSCGGYYARYNRQRVEAEKPEVKPDWHYLAVEAYNAGAVY